MVLSLVLGARNSRTLAAWFAPLTVDNGAFGYMKGELVHIKVVITLSELTVGKWGETVVCWGN